MEMELIPWRASAARQALGFRSPVRHLTAPAVTRELLFPRDSEPESVNIAVCLHPCLGSAALSV